MDLKGKYPRIWGSLINAKNRENFKNASHYRQDALGRDFILFHTGMERNQSRKRTFNGFRPHGLSRSDSLDLASFEMQNGVSLLD